MKTVTGRLGFLAKLGLVAGMLFSGQQALAQTAAGTPVNNTASVSFSVGGIAQTPVDSNEASFVVDRRVDFVLNQVGTALTPVTPGVDGVFIEFVLQNDSNSALDFDLAQLALASGDPVRATTATGAVMDNVTIEVAEFPASAGDPAPVLGAGRTDVTALAPGDTIRIRVYADTPLTLVNNDIAGIQLNATAALAGAPLTETAGADRLDEIDNVFVNGADVSGNATESQTDGFSVTAADISAAKSSATVADPINGATDPKPIPGAFVEYSITVTNNGAETATGVSIADTLDLTLVALRDGAYNGSASNVSLGGSVFCNADSDATDGCTYDAGTGAIAIATPDIAAGGNVTVTFQVVVQ